MTNGKTEHCIRNLAFIGPCIVVYFYSKTNQKHNISIFLFSSSNLHVSDGLSVHHQESKTVHTASGICHTDSADCFLAGTRWKWFHLVPSSNYTIHTTNECSVRTGSFSWPHELLA